MLLIKVSTEILTLLPLPYSDKTVFYPPLLSYFLDEGLITYARKSVSRCMGCKCVFIEALREVIQSNNA